MTQPSSRHADLTNAIAETAEPPSAGQYFIRDARLPGFVQRVTSGGVKSWIVEARVKGQRSTKRRTLGRYPQVKADRARTLVPRAGSFQDNFDPLDADCECPTMARPAPLISLTAEQSTELETLARSREVAHSLVQRAQLVLSAAEGESNKQIASLRPEAEGRRRRTVAATLVRGSGAAGHTDGAAPGRGDQGGALGSPALRGSRGFHGRANLPNHRAGLRNPAAAADALDARRSGA